MKLNFQSLLFAHFSWSLFLDSISKKVSCLHVYTNVCVWVRKKFLSSSWSDPREREEKRQQKTNDRKTSTHFTSFILFRTSCCYWLLLFSCAIYNKKRRKNFSFPPYCLHVYSNKPSQISSQSNPFNNFVSQRFTMKEEDQRTERIR